MVQIFIKKSNDDTQNNELILIELQGTFESNQPSLNNLTIGDLDLSDENHPKLNVGNQQLIGIRKILKEPLALIVNQSSQREAQDTTNLTYSLRCLIREKLLFEGRPMLVTTTTD